MSNQFKNMPDGTDLIIDGLHYRKHRPWAPEQFNASLHEGRPDLPMFVKIEPDTEVLIFLDLPAWRLN